MRNNDSRVAFDFDPDVVDSLGSLIPNRTYTLSEQDFFNLNIASTETSVILSQRSNHDIYNMTSALQPSEPFGPYEYASELFIEEINSEPDERLRAIPLKPSSVIGDVRVYDETLSRHQNLVTPINAGKLWIVKSALEQIDTDGPEVLERFLGSHAFILSSLSAAISEIRPDEESDDQEDEQRPRPKRKIVTLSWPVIEATSTDIELVTESADEEAETIDPFINFYGIGSAIEELREVIELANIPDEIREEHGASLKQAIILSGPSGVGKTELAGALAEGLDAELWEIRYSDLASTNTGGWGLNISSKFNAARGHNGRVVLFFDEADGLLRSGNEGSNSNIESALKKELEELKRNPNIFVVIATNDESFLSPEIRAKKRIPLTIRLQKPNEEERIEIFDKMLGLAGLPDDTIINNPDNIVFQTLMREPDFYDFRELAQESNDFTAGDIVSAISSIRTKRLIKFKNDPYKLKRLITQEEILAELRNVRRTREV